ncbi:alginate O-acetyltransferase AlgF [Neogemmobacter tilapiae]|uniref:Alginate biosynthesis protein AlgF n=1 Tax=Neogemmobacter tilapiae TaxID=875041 RepID=A0A918WL94_9RHOB|nr:alginate O-acetyltransferase AlgF [Gemmobacter tilapiae]GHC56697.1 hypothetical protein GCM10007315_20090 [Gemmobacter tilapiae]
MIMRFLPLCLTLVLTLPAQAQDAGLYDQVASPDASFVRVIVPAMGLGAVGATSFAALQDGVSPYVVIDQPGAVAVTAGSAQGSIEVAPAGFYTYVLAADGSGVMVQDQITRGAAKADVAFYNLSDLPSVDLFVPQAKAVAIPKVAADQAGFVALKAPLTLDFEAKQGDSVLASAASVDLKRREGVTLVLIGSAGNYQLTATPNSLQP